VETARIAFSGRPVPVLCDWRLRECDYGLLNGELSGAVHTDRLLYLDQPYPGGESWRQAVHRVGRTLGDLRLRWEVTRVLVIGHIATRWAFEHFLNGIALEDLAQAEFHWQPGWEYRMEYSK
jgi:broad specificity phosphatase PhoE